ncbi:MAG: 2Fe-2S iron-sulfur cluster-binding protein, partial [Chloroflexota bacterium]|nr:2Fe-2S iron-sulfur cluster-binding protein [Anaerolineales bacterium]
MMNKTIFIDGRTITLEGNKTVLELARENGIYIPSLCYHPKLDPSSNCRVCMVEVEGMRGLQASCHLTPTDGMKIHTNSPSVLESHSMIVNMLLSNGNHDCLACEVNGDCELQDAAYHLGIEVPAFIMEQKYPRDHSAAFIMRDPNKCILCGRCIAGCNEL